MQGKLWVLPHRGVTVSLRTGQATLCLARALFIATWHERFAMFMPMCCHCRSVTNCYNIRLGLSFCEALLPLLTKHLSVFLSHSLDILSFLSVPILWTPHRHFIPNAKREKNIQIVFRASCFPWKQISTVYICVSLRTSRYKVFVWIFSPSSWWHKPTNSSALKGGPWVVHEIWLAIWRCIHRASSYNMYKNQQDVQNSCDQTLFSIRCSTCFGLY